MVFDRLRKRLRGSLNDEYSGDEYLELDLGAKEKDSKVLVKLFFLKNYEDVNEILTSLREGYTIAVIDIKTLRQKDSIELKRAVSKIKKTTEALEGSIAGFGENIVIVTPSFAKIHKDIPKSRDDQQKRSKFDY